LPGKGWKVRVSKNGKENRVWKNGFIVLTNNLKLQEERRDLLKAAGPEVYCFRIGEKIAIVPFLFQERWEG
jgi:hypothetical protein